MRKAKEEQARREAEDEAALAKKAAAAANSKEPQPFSFATGRRGERKKQPLLYMDVNLAPGKTGRIGLHEGDDPERLAANFARAYQLDGPMRARLQQLIEQYMAEVVPGLAAASADEAAGSPSGARSPSSVHAVSP
jgi:hypothetical protein